MPDTQTDLNPGTAEAIAAGCTCSGRDGEAQQSDRWPDWLTRGCPVHDGREDFDADSSFSAT